MTTRVNAICKVKVYEINDEEVPLNKNEVVTVETHWDVEDFVVITVDDKKLTVSATDLIKAIQRCSR